MALLTGHEVRRLGIVHLTDEQAAAAVQPNGVDLRLGELWTLAGPGALGRAPEERHLPDRAPLAADSHGWLTLGPGTYGLRFADAVALPNDCGALVFPRSSLLRMGVTLPTAVWDAGYHGRAESLLLVHNAHGVRVQPGARVAQLVVFRLEAPSQGYAGRYQGENLGGTA